MVEDLFEHGGDHPGAVSLFTLDQIHPRFGIELAGEEEGASAVDGGEGGLDAGDVVHGKGEEVAFLNFGVGGGDAGEHV